MLDLAREIIGSQPILTAFLAIGLGYLVGQISIFGFSLGVGAVLFVGLAIGAFAPKAQIIGPIGLTGLIMFLYGIGILYGRQFFEGMVGAGQKYNLLALVACLAGLAGRARPGAHLRHQDRTYARPLRRIDDEHRNAPGRARRRQEQGSVDRLLDRLSVRRHRPDPLHLLHDPDREAEIPGKDAALPHGRDFDRRSFAGRRLGDLMTEALSGLQVTMVRKGGHNFVPTDDTILSAGDAVLVVAEDNEAIATPRPSSENSNRAGWPATAPTSTTSGSSSARPAWSVSRLPSLPMPAGYPTHLLHVRRYDADLVPAPDLMLEFGDRVGVLTPPDRKEEIRRHFGDTVKAAAEFSYVSLGLGMVMGVLLGLIPIPIPGVGIVTLGIGGGPLIVALILGKLRRTGPMLWTMPLPANIVLRNFGLAMFLATVGVNAGQPFVRTVAESGLTMLFIGVAVLLTTVFIVLLVGHYVMKIPYDDLVGVASGATGNPAILVYSTKMAPTERPDIGYAMIFPSMTLVKVIAAQIVGLLTVGNAG